MVHGRVVVALVSVHAPIVECRSADVDAPEPIEAAQPEPAPPVELLLPPDATWSAVCPLLEAVDGPDGLGSRLLGPETNTRVRFRRARWPEVPFGPGLLGVTLDPPTIGGEPVGDDGFDLLDHRALDRAVGIVPGPHTPWGEIEATLRLVAAARPAAIVFPPCGGSPWGRWPPHPDGKPHRTFHHAELDIRERVDVAPVPGDLADRRCLVGVIIDEQGTPEEIRVSECPRVLHPSVRAAMAQWRWFPPEYDQQRVRALTHLAMTVPATDAHAEP